MSSGNSFFESKQFKTIMKFVYGWGGAVVIVGAMFKIQHWPGATIMLIGGLGIEAVIFILSAFEPLHEEIDWTLAYPELAMGHGEDDDVHALPDISSDDTVVNDDTVIEQLDNMLAKAKIEPELIESLGSGMRNLSENANKLGDISSASDATEEYVDSLKGASAKVGEMGGVYEKASSSISEKANQLGDAYEKAANTVEQLTASTNTDTNYTEQLEKVSTNLAALNNVYEMQVKGANEHLNVSNEMYTGINELMGNLHSSLDDTRKYKETMAQLTENLESLNTVYGNMLSAMNVNK
ncbi:MAG: gliding motility protein GldL [Crocinitomicaceae bacterium]|nr:gliding motility protein GldL [Crocinitomicaceae bacterium]|tara:strand:+ start:21618 stop:22505 length:888 start_codon:yes stop_codon:yes gene_type:complete